ncbi:uncharacterized protein LOC113206676 isoform X2 [Frankliniella occidentalis]|uniref:Uncharacterized protein LOC113206676 isoform X2 n=1 Tax=Frankliniella occidentalis TaxID=133901 RepID=A0A6J1SBX9_FRAOC|nr:uncharacterized protein LOC113206676 isoform X2 [Frankliniella occidentalis]
MDLECDICTERFDSAERLPKVLLCGHTACLQCLRRLPDSSCPTCRRNFNGPPEGLITNFILLKSEGVRLDSPRCWCLDCRTAPSPRCWDEDHDVLPFKRALLRRQLQGKEPFNKALWLLLAAMVSLIEALYLLSEAMSTLYEVLRELLCASVYYTQSGCAGPSCSTDPTTPAAAPTPPEATLAVLDSQPAEAPPPRDAAGVSGVTRLVSVRCDEDPAWSLQLLQRAAPTLERLSVYHPREAHLRAVHDMPRLRRLAVHCNNAAAQLPQLPALPPGHAGLQWLRVCLLPRATTQSLLRAHGGTLEELELGVGTAGSDEWPRSCGDLHSLLQQTGLRALRRLVLLRRRAYSHEPAACSQQRAEVRRVLPGAEVLCGRCDRVREEEV